MGRSITTRLAAFTGGPVLAALAPLLIIPVITRATGAGGWASFAAGQSVGLIGMIVLTFGWGIVGPVRIAQHPDPADRARILLESLVTRAVAAAVVLPVSALVAWWVATPDYRLAAAAIAVATAAAGFTPAWFCIGAGQPGLLTVYDVLPRLGAAAAGAALIFLTGEIAWYAVVLALSCVVAFGWHARVTMRDHDLGHLDAAEIRTALRRQVPTAAIDTVANSYGSTPTPIATGSLATSAADSFASANTMYRFGLIAVVAFGNAFQGWVLEPDAEDPRARHRLAIVAHGALGVAGAIGLAALGPWASSIVMGADNAATWTASALFGAAFFAISFTTPFIRNVMIPHGRYRYVFVVTCASSLVGLSVMLAGAAMSAMEVIAGGMVAAELVIMVAIIVPAWRLLADRVPSRGA